MGLRGSDPLLKAKQLRPLALGFHLETTLTKTVCYPQLYASWRILIAPGLAPTAALVTSSE